MKNVADLDTFPGYTREERCRIGVLMRRRDWLESRAAHHPATYDVAELSALNWVLDELSHITLADEKGVA